MNTHQKIAKQQFGLLELAETASSHTQAPSRWAPLATNQRFCRRPQPHWASAADHTTGRADSP